jgi:hypothetical protein
MKVGGYTRHGVEQLLRMQIARVGSQYQFATLHHLSPQYVHDVLNGRRNPGPKMLAALNLEARILFYPTMPIKKFIRSIQP